MVATTIYKTENCGADNITPGEDVSRTNSDFRGGGCRGEANTNVPGAPRILDPPLDFRLNYTTLILIPVSYARLEITL